MRRHALKRRNKARKADDKLLIADLTAEDGRQRAEQKTQNSEWNREYRRNE
jgi:hypothetical protein